MANPLNNSNQNPMNGLLQFLNNGGSPIQFAQQFMSNNPQAAQLLQQLQQKSVGQNPKEIAMHMAQRQGLDPNLIMQVAHKMGLK